MQSQDFPIVDPTPDLAPTAKRILDAGIRIMHEHGFAGLTFEKVARESGENGALIRYHFGSKAGLVKAIVDTILYSEATGLLDLLAPLPPGRERKEALSRRRYEVASNPDAFRPFFDLLPNLLRNPELRPTLQELMKWYRSLDTWAISPADPDGIKDSDLETLALLSVAVEDGLALQVQADPDLDLKRAFEVWEQFVDQYLEKLRGNEGGGTT